MSGLDQLIRSALDEGKSTYHEAMPDDFGADMRRATLLRECLIMLLSRYARLQIQVVGSPGALAKVALAPGANNRIGLFRVPASWGPTARPGAIRLVFSPGVALAPLTRPGDAQPARQHPPRRDTTRLANR